MYNTCEHETEFMFDYKYFLEVFKPNFKIKSSIIPERCFFGHYCDKEYIHLEKERIVLDYNQIRSFFKDNKNVDTVGIAIKKRKVIPVRIIRRYEIIHIGCYKIFKRDLIKLLITIKKQKQETNE